MSQIIHVSPYPLGMKPKHNFSDCKMDRFEGKNWEVLIGSSVASRSPDWWAPPAGMIAQSPHTGTDLSLHTDISRKFSTRVLLTSSTALHHNCQLSSQCCLPTFSPTSRWLTGVLSSSCRTNGMHTGPPSELPLHTDRCRDAATDLGHVRD